MLLMTHFRSFLHLVLPHPHDHILGTQQVAHIMTAIYNAFSPQKSAFNFSIHHSEQWFTLQLPHLLNHCKKIIIRSCWETPSQAGGNVSNGELILNPCTITRDPELSPPPTGSNEPCLYFPREKAGSLERLL